MLNGWVEAGMRHCRSWLIAGGALARLAGYVFWGLRPLGRILRVKLGQTVKLELRADWGEQAKITSLQQIKSVEAAPCRCAYLRVPLSAGYQDAMTFTGADGQTSSLLISAVIKADGA